MFRKVTILLFTFKTTYVNTQKEFCAEISVFCTILYFNSLCLECTPYTQCVRGE